MSDVMEIEDTVEETPASASSETKKDEDEPPASKEKSPPLTEVETVETKKEEQADIIVLDDDEQTDVIDLVGQTPVGDRKCINYLCRSGVNLMTPPIFCTSYFRVRIDSNKNKKICEECYDLAAHHYDECAIALTESGNIMDVDCPLRNETVAIDDSDSEDETTQEEEVLIDLETRKMLELELDDVLEKSAKKFKYEETIDEAIKCLNQRYEANNDSYLEVKTMVDNIRKEVDTMLLDLFGMLRVDNTQLPELIITTLDANSSMMISYDGNKPGITPVKGAATPITKLAEEKGDGIPMERPRDLPPRGRLIKPSLRLGQFYFAKRTSNLCSWVKVKLENIFSPEHPENNTDQSLYQVSRENNQKISTKRFVTAKELAYAKPAEVVLEVGARVIALFKEYGEMRMSKRDAFYPGVVGEHPGPQNKYRYLIFFDDGYAHYVDHDHVFLIFESSKDVWEDVNEDSRSFIKKYITEYPNRPMVKLMKNQTVRTEFRGKWYMTTVMNVDCSLVQMFFDSQSRVEWIYRGSRRLNTMYKEEQAATSRLQNRGRAPRAITGGNVPYVQYTRDDSDVILITEENKGPQRSVAKKSTRAPVMPIHQQIPAINKFLPEKTDVPPGKIVYYTPRKQNPSAKVYRPHSCNSSCQKDMTTLSRLKGYGPLAKPLLCGFYRMHSKLSKGKKPVVFYKSPCGKSIRNMEEMHRYLQCTKSQLTVDLFNFDHWVRCLAEFILDPNTPVTKDLSQGFEEIQIPVVNYVDNVINDFVNYSTKRMPMEGVTLNLDPEFLFGCDCEDDCTNKDKCSCWQLTLQGAKYLNKEPNDIGYEYRRLHDSIFTGIYECNSRCKCAKTCLNRVVQNPIQHKLQVFKTVNRGWGIRCINDIPQGSFVCIYAGALLTDQMANEGGKNYGDEYYAELDYIESAENAKEDYEEEAYHSEEESSQASIHSPEEEDEDDEEYDEETIMRKHSELSDNDFVFKSRGGAPTQDYSNIRNRLRRRTTNELDDKKGGALKKPAVPQPKKYITDDDDTVMISDDEDEREPSSFNPTNVDEDLEKPRRYKSVREMFGKDENVYIMDAKNTGNIGRYLNHSCNPNIFVQNVFVDTHDLRFPWVSFFAMNYIRAGTELTWNYNYDIGSVQDKVLLCRCGSSECKGRLL